MIYLESDKDLHQENKLSSLNKVAHFKMVSIHNFGFLKIQNTTQKIFTQRL